MRVAFTVVLWLMGLAWGLVMGVALGFGIAFRWCGGAVSLWSMCCLLLCFYVIVCQEEPIAFPIALFQREMFFFVFSFLGVLLIFSILCSKGCRPEVS